MRKRDNERHDNWLLIKAEDDAARAPGAKDILEEQPRLGHDRPLHRRDCRRQGRQKAGLAQQACRGTRSAAGRRLQPRSAAETKIDGVAHARRTPRRPRPRAARRVPRPRRAPRWRKRRCPISSRSAWRRSTAPLPAGTNGCTRSNSTAIAWRPGSTTARCAAHAQAAGLDPPLQADRRRGRRAAGRDRAARRRDRRRGRATASAISRCCRPI